MRINEDKSLKIFNRSFWEKRYEHFEENPEYTRKSEVLGIDFHGTVANVKIRTIVEWPKETVVWVDFLNMLKVDDKWQIVNKIYDEEKIPKE